MIGIAGQLIFAMLVVHWVPLPRWRGTLGSIIESDALPQCRPPHVGPWSGVQSDCWWLARRIDAIADCFPFTIKCLPRAIVLQWISRREQIDVTLILATVRGHGQSEATIDRFHAWVECQGKIMIGICNPAHYAPFLAIASGSHPA